MSFPTRHFALAFSILSLAVTAPVFAQAPAPAAKPITISKWTNQPDEWFKSDEGQRIVSNILTHQKPVGGWDKTYDTTKPAKDAPKREGNPLAPASDNADVWGTVATIDNDATYSELRVLARAVRVTGREDARIGFEKGMAWLLKSQYPNGGFPQRYPLQNNYGRHITYNDDAMANVLYLLRDIAAGQKDFAWVPADTKEKSKAAFDRGIDCILATQIVVDGKPTVWCQQHDEVTLKPAKARSYEFPTFCSNESGKLAVLLMELPNPTEAQKAAIEGAIAWLEAHKIENMEYARLRGSEYEKGYDRRLVKKDGADPVWPRFSDLETGKPVFYDRDGSKHASEAELGYERRTGYAWYSTSPNAALKAYPAWKAKHGK